MLGQPTVAMAPGAAEGFLCPVCMLDLGEAARLQVHFEECTQAKEDPALVKELKDFFATAKKKILNEGPESGDRGQTAASVTKTADVSILTSKVNAWDLLPSEPQEYDVVTGVSLSRVLPRPAPKIADMTRGFVEERRRRLDRNKIASQVLVRLERLLDGIPSDPSGRRAHERRVVPWLDEELVKLCPQCGKSFNLKRRKHHCRLCGSVLCGDCSTAVDFDLARAAVNPASLAQFDGQNDGEGRQADGGFDGGGVNPRKGLRRLRAGSHESLNTIVGIMEQKLAPEARFRSCATCLAIVEAQLRRSEADSGLVHPLTDLYDRLQKLMEEGRLEATAYRETACMLARGEDGYDPREAKLQRLKLLKTAEAVDAISKRIANMGMDARPPLGPTRLTLQTRIRQSAANFVKGELVGLPDVPTEEEYEGLKRRRRCLAEAKAEEERQAATTARAKLERENFTRRASPNVLSPNGGASKSLGGKASKLGSGFVLTSPASASFFSSSEDPMVQQIRNIRQFIREARTMGKHDEVKALEENLRELQAEYQRAQREMKELEENFDQYKGMFHKHSPSKQPQPVADDTSAPVDQPYVDIDEYDSSGKNPFFEAA